jgi:hypothetical protein
MTGLACYHPRHTACCQCIATGAPIFRTSQRPTEEATMGHASEYEHLHDDAAAATAEPATDPLFPKGRPPCHLCLERPVYLAGLCGPCYAAEDQRRAGVRRALGYPEEAPTD